MVAARKGELLAALGQCSCARCAAVPVLMQDGCESHSVSAAQVAAWWALAEERDAEVSCCHCCAGPAPSGSLVCRRCEEATG